MKLIIQIPCFNEESTLPATVKDLPKTLPGITEIQYLVIDDGSTDRTVEVAKQLGIHHILSLGSNQGLAAAFRRGIEEALLQGADIIVNTDADNQYYGGDIAKLIQPIIDRKADMVVGCRPITQHPEFHPLKKMLQLFGSWILRHLSKTKIRDAASGFRAFSREACQRLFIYSKFSYCMESLIQAGNSGFRVSSVDIQVNLKTRESRLFKNIAHYIYKSGTTILTMFVLYRPGSFFVAIGSFFSSIACFLGLRFIYLIYWADHVSLDRSYLPSLILFAVCMLTSMILYALAIIGMILKSQRRVTEENLYLLRQAMTYNEK